MAATTFEKIRIKPYPKDNILNLDAWDEKNPAGTLRAVWDQSEQINAHIIMLDKILVEPEYRGLGIANKMLQDLLLWCKQREGATELRGYIDEHLLENDTPEHVAAYLAKQGFTVEGNEFSMNIVR